MKRASNSKFITLDLEIAKPCIRYTRFSFYYGIPIMENEILQTILDWTCTNDCAHCSRLNDYSLVITYILYIVSIERCTLIKHYKISTVHVCNIKNEGFQNLRKPRTILEYDKIHHKYIYRIRKNQRLMIKTRR